MGQNAAAGGLDRQIRTQTLSGQSIQSAALLIDCLDSVEMGRFFTSVPTGNLKAYSRIWKRFYGCAAFVRSLSYRNRQETLMFKRLCLGALLLAGLVLSFNGCNTDSPSGLTTIVISPTTVTVALAPPGFSRGKPNSRPSDTMAMRVIRRHRISPARSPGLPAAARWLPSTVRDWPRLPALIRDWLRMGWVHQHHRQRARIQRRYCQQFRDLQRDRLHICASIQISPRSPSIPATQTVASLGVAGSL